MLQGGLTVSEWTSFQRNGGLRRRVKPSVAPISVSNSQTWQAFGVGVCVCARLCILLLVSFLSLVIQSHFDILGKLFCHVEWSERIEGDAVGL